MNYKISTIVLLLALIAVVIFHISTTNQKIETTQDSIENMQGEPSGEIFFDKELAERFKKDSSRFKPNHGRLISPDKAQKKLNDFLKNPNRPNISNPYGYSFGVNNFLEFANYVDSLKNNGTPNRGKIIGVRVYKAITKDTITNKKYYDVFMIPVAEDGFDYPKIHDFKDNDFLDGGDGILNASVPCPDQCN